jgi:pimeloyl-ACP methyl ester carboxylesterase
MRAVRRNGVARNTFAVSACLVLTLAASCSSSKGTASPSSATSSTVPISTTPPTPDGDLYAPPDPLPYGAPGTLIWAEKVSFPDLHPPSTVWRMLYHSRSEQARDIAVSGFAIVPTAHPEGKRPVFAWAHGTVGLGDQCAPSRAVRDNLFPFGGYQADRGALLVATDYEGVGTPGVPTLSGVAEGQAVLDGVRAASALPNVGTIGAVVVAGHSQGGPAALFAAEIAPEYAPNLDLVGVVALAPGAELAALADALAESPAKGQVLIGAAGLRAAHPDLDLSAGLTASALRDLPRVEGECVDTTVERYAAIPSRDVVTRPPSEDPALKKLFDENSPGAKRILVPIFIGHGVADQQVPVELSERLRAKYCALGGNVTRKTYPGKDHEGVIDASEKDVLAFLTARYTKPQPDSNGCT